MKLTLLRHGDTAGSRDDLYYGAADACVGLAEMPLAKMVESCYETGRFMR